MTDSEDDQSEEEDNKIIVESKAKPELRDNSEAGPTNRRRRRKKEAVTFCVTDCKYEVIFDCVKGMGWRLAGSVNEEGKHCTNDELATCNVHWVDVANVHERLSKMAPWQHINHFPGMTNIARKGKLASNLEKMRREFPKEYGFYPRTWVLPLELGDFRTQFDSKGISSRVYIIKPDAGCQGRGIFLTQDLSKVPLNEPMVAQQYIRKPLLIDGFKFDLRIYILVTSCSPLRMYMFHDGLVRLCTSEYVKPTQENLNERCMHLTNYAINKMSDNFVQNDGMENGMGSKRTLKWFMDWVSRDRGEVKAQQLWKKIGGVAVKVVSSILPTLQREYGEKFERNKNLKEFRRRAEATAALIAETKARDAAKEGGSAAKGFAFGSGREDASHRVRRAEAAASALEKLRLEEEEAAMKNNKEEIEEDDENNGKSHCFELLGIDIMIDNSLKPWLIEINHLPSFATDSPLDQKVKSQVIKQTLSVVTATAQDRRKYDESNKRDSGQRLYGKAGQAPTNKEGEGDKSDGKSSNRPSISPITTNRPEIFSVAAAKKRIIAVYNEHAPERLPMVDGLLAKYSGREAKLVSAVESKYTTKVDSSSASSSNASSADGSQRRREYEGDGGGIETPGAAGLVPEEGAWNHVLSFDSAIAVPRAGVIPAMRRRPSQTQRSTLQTDEEEEEERERMYIHAADDIDDAGMEKGEKNKENRDGEFGQHPGKMFSRENGSSQGIDEAPPPRREQGDMCDLIEARRRIEAMYNYRWRHGMSQSQHARVLETEDVLLEDFDRIFPLPRDLLPAEDEVSEESTFYIPDYDRCLVHAFEHDDKKFKRMYGAKTSNPGPAGEEQVGNGTDAAGAPLPLSSLLPPIGGGGFCFGGGDEKGGRNVFGDPFKQGRSERAGDAKLLPKPGPKQAAAAERLTRGFSVKRQTQSAPSGAIEQSQMNGGDEGEEDGFDEEGGSRHAEHVAYAKKLRERTMASKNKRNAVALKPTMYCFTDSGPMLGQSSSHFGSFGQAGF